MSTFLEWYIRWASWYSAWVSSWLGPVAILLLLFGVVLAFVSICRSMCGNWMKHMPCCGFFGARKSEEDSPLEIAKRRFARGEITREEFEEIRRTVA